MPTKSFTRNIEIYKPASIRKIHCIMKANEVAKFSMSIKALDFVKKQSRARLASKLTKKY